MAAYVGNRNNPGDVIAAGAQVQATFLPGEHQVIAKEVKTYLSAAARFATAAKTAEASATKEDATRAALAEADAERDEALRALDRKLIDAGAPKANAFKSYGFEAPSRIANKSFAEETKLVAKLVKAVLGRKGQAAGVVAAAKALLKSNDAVLAAEARVEVAAEATARARAARDAIDCPTRGALSVLKLQVRLAEKQGLVGAYAQLFATGKARAP